MADYQFKYSPLTGRLTGNQMIEQTEQAINALASQVDSAAGQVEIISTLANEANENAATALEVANEALATTGRTYLTVSTQTDANNYYDSQLIYIADSTSTNIPVADTGMLEVKTNDNKTACEQVFIADSSGEAYYRNGAITAETVGDVTTYSVTWGGWSSEPASQAYVQGELANYLPLSGGTVTGDLTVSEDITGNLTGNVTGLASENLPLAGGTMLGSIAWGQGEIGYRATTHTSPYDPCKQLIATAGTVSSEWDDGNAKLALHTYDRTGTNTAENGAFVLQASNGTNAPYLEGLPSGDLKWDGYEVSTKKVETVTVSMSPVGNGSITIRKRGNVCQMEIQSPITNLPLNQYTALTAKIPSGYRPISDFVKTVFMSVGTGTARVNVMKVVTNGTISFYGYNSAITSTAPMYEVFTYLNA